MLALLLLACGGPIDGVWMFTRAVALPATPTCTQSVTHNAVGAREPEATSTEDTAWVETDTAAESGEVFFGRVTRTDDGGALLLLGTEVLVGTQGESGDWAFAWTGNEDSRDSDAHVGGYRYAHTAARLATQRLTGNFASDGFDGTWDDESMVTETWTESDAWEDAAPYVSDPGRIPLGTYLVKDDGAGGTVAVANGRTSYDCGSGSNGANGCALTVVQSCAYRTTLTATRTDMSGEDDGWAAGAGQPSGI